MLQGATLRYLVPLLLSVQGQKGIGSLNDPCDCMQHHDFWVASRRGLMDIFWAPDYPLRALDPEDHLHFSTRRQSCLYSPENEESHRPTALSDCIPGFILVHIVCMQRHLANRNPERAMDFATELVRLLPFGASCIDKAGWPITSAQILGYYRRFRRAFAAGPYSLQGKLDMLERGQYATQREMASEAGSPDIDPWPNWLLREMLWQVGSEGDQRQQLGEEPDVCPAGSYPEGNACWLLGKTGASCQEACQDAGMQLRLQEKTASPPDSALEEADWPALFGEPHVPHIVAAMSGNTPSLGIQHPWAPFECLVPEESRFHLAARWLDQDPTWSYPLCALACPCAPIETQTIQGILEAIPMWPSAV